jgi:hypothetical protein
MSRYIILVGATPAAEGKAGPPPAEMLAAVAKLNEEMNAAGILLGGEGLQPTSKDGYRVNFSTSGPPKAKKGPFDLAEQATVSGWWIVRTKDVEEALEWAKKIPFKEGYVEIRRISEASDFGEEFTPEMREREEKLREEVEKRQ